MFGSVSLNGGTAPRAPTSKNSVTGRSQEPIPSRVLSCPNRLREALCQTIVVLYSYPQACKTVKPSGSSGVVAHRKQTLERRMTSAIGSAQSSSTDNVGYFAAAPLRRDPPER